MSYSGGKGADRKGKIRLSTSARGRRSAARTTRIAICAVEGLEARQLLTAAGLVTTPQIYSGPLNGKIVFTSGGHGFGWNSSTGTYMTDRPDYWQNSSDTSDGDLVEDLGNQDQMSIYADYLLRAGATVVPMRPVGRQVNEVVLDNDSPDVTFSANWSNSTNTRFYDEDYGATTDAIPYKFANTVIGASTATATYTPNIPAAGFYPVYTWVHYGTDRTAQTYTINHTGGSTQITVDHSIVGDGWVYLGTYHFNAGKSATGEGSVVITNSAPVTGKVVIADAIRFGNGMGDYVESGAPGVSGYPREDENSYHWVARSIGQGTTLSAVIGSDTNVSAPSDFAQYMYHGVFGGALYIGFHSNGSTGIDTTATSRGAVGLYAKDAINRTPNQITLAQLMADQINQDMTALDGTFETTWSTPATNTDSHINFGEIDLGAGAEMDATICEVAYHDNVQDNELLRDPKVRDQIARSVFQGTLQYFATYGNPVITNTSLPTAPVNVSAVSNASGQVTINWAAGANTPATVFGDPATGFKVYASVDGYGFDGGTTVAGGGATSITLAGYDPNTPYYFKVTATNAGGESKGSEIIAALPSGGAKNVMIVNGFDRLDRTQDIRYPYTQSGYPKPDPDGAANRVYSRYNNTFDYITQFVSAIQNSKPGTHFDSTSNEDVINGSINLGNYKTVMWILGNESTANHTFDATEQTDVTNFINAGGNLFVSGSEIAWDLDSQNHGRSFYQNTLKASFVADDANTYNIVSAGGGIFAGLSSGSCSNNLAGSFSSLDGQTYDVATPDVISPQSGAVAALTYSGGTGGTAGIQVVGANGKGSIVMFGFPFETLTSSTLKQQMMGKVLDFFTTTLSPAPGAPVLAAASDTGTPGDNKTKLNNSSVSSELQFSVPGTTVGATVSLYSSGTLIGSTTAVATTTTITTNGASTLADGVRSITARQTLAGQLQSGDSTPLNITIDTIAPTATVTTISSPKNTSILSDTIVFSEAINGLSLANVSLTRDAGSSLLTASQTPTTSDNITFTISNLSTLTGNAGLYSLSVPASGAISDAAGNTLVTNASTNWVMNTIALPPGSNTLRIVRNGAQDDLYINSASVTYSIALSDFSSLLLGVLTSGTNDAITLDYGGGSPIPAGNLNITGSGGNDSLAVLGSTGSDTASFGSDVVTFAGTITYGAIPTLSFDGKGGGDTLAVYAGSLMLPTTQNLASLSIGTGAGVSLPQGGSATLVTNSLVIVGTGYLDVSDDALIVNYTTTAPTSLRDYLVSGRNAPAASAAPWNGPGIRSTYALNNGNGFNLAIGQADNNALAAVNANGSYTSFAGQTVSSNCVLIQLTYGADANLDRVVDGKDVAIIGTHFQKPGSGQWCFGDFDYSGTCDGSDVAVLGTTFGKTSPALSPAQSSTLTPLAAPATSPIKTSTATKPISSPEPRPPAIPFSSLTIDADTIYGKSKPKHRPPLSSNGIIFA